MEPSIHPAGPRGLVIVNTGDGKGKTTAALGILFRACGHHQRTSVIQFIKPENGRYGETRTAEKLGIDWAASGDGFTWASTDLEHSRQMARAGWALAQKKILSEQYDVLVLDEFTYPLHFLWLDTREVLAWLREHKPAPLHLVITGRYAPPELIDYADLVTEMKLIKHPFEAGIAGQKGIEF